MFKLLQSEIAPASKIRLSFVVNANEHLCRFEIEVMIGLRIFFSFFFFFFFLIRKLSR